MKPEIKEKWLAALKSGKYVQGQGVLQGKSGNAFTHCCLGVLCDIHMQETREGHWDENGVYWCRKDGSCSDRVLPAAVQTWAGVETIGTFEPASGYRGDNCLTGINDNSSKTDYSDVIPIIEAYF
jgi:hypothetical protein